MCRCAKPTPTAHRHEHIWGYRHCTLLIIVHFILDIDNSRAGGETVLTLPLSSFVSLQTVSPLQSRRFTPE